MARGELLVLARAGQVGEERKRVLKICVSKLQTIHDPEAFLCRSVLINNTLRQIQEEHRQVGQRRARLKRARHVVEEEEEEGSVDRSVQISVDNFDGVEGKSKRFCPEPQHEAVDAAMQVQCPISAKEDFSMATAYYQDGIYKEEVLQKASCSDSLEEDDGEEVDEEEDETDEEEEEEEDDDEEEEDDDEEEEDSYDLPLEETPMLGSIEISVVSTAFTDPERKTEEEARLDDLPDQDETSSSSEEGVDDGGGGLYHCPYSLLLPSSQPLPSLNCAL